MENEERGSNPQNSWGEEDSYEKDDFREPPERKSLLGNTEKKRSIGFLIVFLAVLLVGAFLIFKNDQKEQPEGIIQESEQFEPAPKRVIPIPKTPVQEPFEDIPSEDEIRRAQELEALRQARLKSAILIYQGGSSANQVEEVSSNESAITTNPVSGHSQDPNAQFYQASKVSSFPRAQASTITNLGSTILQGKLIDAVLETGINSDLPGMIRAIVSRDIYGEAGNQILIPRGSRLIGRYNSAIRKGQARVFVIWNRLIRSDGIEVALNSGGTDPLGVSGMKGKVNNHFFQIFGTSALLSILGAGSATAGVDSMDQNNSLAMYRQEIANSFRESSAGILEQYANIPPTITVKQGALIKVFVAQDLDFSTALNRHPHNKMIFVQ